MKVQISVADGEIMLFFAYLHFCEVEFQLRWVEVKIPAHLTAIQAGVTVRKKPYDKVEFGYG